MHLLYISALASQYALAEAHVKDPHFSRIAVQKFNRLVAEGFARNGHQVTALSTFYLPNIGLGYHRKKETDEGVRYSYITSPNNQPLRFIWLVLYCFIYVFFWGLFDKKNKALVCDVLNISACIGGVAAARMIGLRRVGIMTDMPGLMVNRFNSDTQSQKRKLSFIATINKSFLSQFTYYVFLTEKMNEAVNKKRKPYIVMEGLVNADMKVPKTLIKDERRIVLYAGGLHERYGIRMLVEGFLRADIPSSELWLYGSGPFTKELTKYNSQDQRVVYKGIRPNQEVVEAELRSVLLVNPRPTHEEYTHYSFPSKNLEYMVSGTPVLTTMLPGMPKEYYSYVFLFDQGETIDGYAKVIKSVLSLPEEELNSKGLKAREWVLSKKNHISQTARIIDLISL